MKYYFKYLMYTLISCMIEMEIKILIKDVIENINK